MELDYVAIAVAAALQFVFGAIWYTPVFGKVWGQIHGFDKQSPAVQKEMKKQMVPLLGMQFLVTIVTTVVLAMFLEETVRGWVTADFSYLVAGLCWLGFIVPTQISAVIFGGTEPRWIVTKIAIMAGAGFGNMMIAAAVLSMM
jgi:hypothetical protein